MAVQLCHEALAESRDLAVGLALRIKVGTAFAAADRQARQGILKDLLKAKELDDAKVYGRMETQATLVGSDCGS